MMSLSPSRNSCPLVGFKTVVDAVTGHVNLIEELKASVT
jgi:hypothetical protein